MRRERSGAFWCHFSPGILAFVPQLHPNCCQPSELSNVPSPTPPIRASELPVRSSAWSAVPVAGLLFRATPRHMHCASGRRRLLRTPLGAHHSTMAQWRASWAFRAQGCVCAGAACVRHASAPHSLHVDTQVRRTRTPRAVAFGYIYGGQRSNICEWPAPRPTVRPLAPAADLRHGRHERPASIPSLAFVVVLLAPLCICLHNAVQRRDSSELGGAGAHWAGHGRVLAQFLLRNPPHTARAPAARRWVQFAPPALPRPPVHPQASISAS